MQESSRTIVIIGGGFSGTVLALNLLRHPPAAPTRILLVEREAQIGCGLAYARRAFPYLLNVPANRMSAIADDTAQLVRFARRHAPDAGAESFLPRQLYGEYLQDTLRAAEIAAPPHVRLQRLHGEATAVRPSQPAGAWLVRVGARELRADQVVLACGDPPPADRGYAADIVGHSAYVRDPYRDECVRSSDRAVLLIGTGLTMVDVAVAAAARNPTVRIVALSRHGLLPQVQRDAVAAVLDARLDIHDRLASSSLRQLTVAVRSLVRTVQRLGGDWREAITRVREVAPTLWQNLDEAERRRFLRHARVYWDVHRHRMPPAIAARIDELRRNGQLQIRAGCIRQLCAEGERLAVLWRARGRFDIQESWADRVVECSGAERRLEGTSDPLLRHLLMTGLASPDTADLGLRTGKYGALIGTDGRAATRLFYLGPMLRADHWEATAVGELRQRAQQLAAVLATASQSERPTPYLPNCYAAVTDNVTSNL